MNAPKLKINLNVDIWMNICEYLNYNDIKALKNVDANMKTTIQQVMGYIVTRELKNQGISKNVLLEHIEYLILNIITAKDFNYIYEKMITGSNVIDSLYYKLSDYYIKNGTIKTYPYQEDIYDLYMFLHIYVYKDTRDIEYKIQYLETMDITKETKKIKYNYYKWILERNIMVKLDMLYIISKTCVTELTLKKLFGLYTLDLSKTRYVKTNRPHLRQLVETKFLNNRSVFYSYNYREIKDFMKRVNTDRWIMMLKWEMRKIWMCRINEEINKPINGHREKITEKQVINNINEKMRRIYFS
jgi:hypothetical protein